jgi:hypothetical protein
MPTIIQTSAAFDALGFALTKQAHTEQVNGLVAVALEFVAKAQSVDSLSQKFYPDAPPPIYPSCISKNELLTKQLYMSDRTVSKANGMITIAANYYGGINRAGWSGYFTTVEKEIKISPFPGDGIPITDTLKLFLPKYYAQYIRKFEYVEIGDQTAVAEFPIVTIGDLRPEFEKQLREFSATKPSLNIEGALILEKQLANVSYKPVFVTPSVKIIQQIHTVD